MRTTLTLDDDVYEAARSLAEASGKRLGEILSELARRGLKSPRAAGKSDRNRDFPVFKVSPRAPVIPATRAAELLVEDER
jgi:hypothetical protein